MKNKIEAIASKIDSELIAIRRHLHQYPELAFEEYQTSAFIQTKLQDWNVAFKTGVAKTGIVAEIKGNNPDRQTFVLRGDMDALPILEENNVEYKSTYEGLMHACGHDVHTTCVLGAVYVLN